MSSEKRWDEWHKALERLIGEMPPKSPMPGDEDCIHIRHAAQVLLSKSGEAARLENMAISLMKHSARRREGQ